MTAIPSASQVLTLARCGAHDPGRALGLRTGDVLIGVEGQPWRGGPEALRARFDAGSAPLLLTFQRGEAQLSLLADHADLGRWERIAAPEGSPAPALPGGAVCNWQIMRRHDGEHDLFALRPQALALVLPPLWLAQARMFTWLAALGAALALSLPGGVILMAVVWCAAGWHLWRHGALHIRQARLAEGYCPVGVLAARTEGEARAAWQALAPGSRFRFDSPRAAASAKGELPVG